MDQQPMMEQQPAAEPQTVGSRMMNVFASPSEAFEGLAEAPKKAMNWLPAYLVMLILSVITVVMMFTNESLKQQMMDQQATALEKRVEEGKMTQAQADQAREGMEMMGSGIFIATGAVGAVVVLSAIFFGGALVFWLIVKWFFKAPLAYGKLMEVMGISLWISVLGGIISLLMMVGLGSMYAQPALSLAVYNSFDPNNTMHKLLGALNVFSIWWMIVLGIGLAKVSHKSSGAGIVASLVVWVIVTALQVSLTMF